MFNIDGQQLIGVANVNVSASPSSSSPSSYLLQGFNILMVLDNFRRCSDELLVDASETLLIM